MEERIIDDEYARGIRLKKTKDGYVDVTDELSEEAKETPPETEEDSVLEGELTESLEDPEAEPEEEVSFEFPELEEDDEDLVNLTPEEAIALRKKKEAEEAARRAEYKRLCEEGEELLLSGSFKAAELKFEKALPLDEEAADAAVGYWRARTSDFSEPDILAEEYAETGYESLENDLGDGAVEKLKANYRGIFEKRIAGARSGRRSAGEGSGEQAEETPRDFEGAHFVRPEKSNRDGNSLSRFCRLHGRFRASDKHPSRYVVSRSHGGIRRSRRRLFRRVRDFYQ